MQNVKKGLIVRTISGHDKNKIYVVVNCDNSYVYLSDGKGRTLDNQKKKNIKHVVQVGMLKDELIEMLNNNKLDNSQIIKTLKDFK